MTSNNSTSESAIEIALLPRDSTFLVLPSQEILAPSRPFNGVSRSSMMLEEDAREARSRATSPWPWPCDQYLKELKNCRKSNSNDLSKCSALERLVDDCKARQMNSSMSSSKSLPSPSPTTDHSPAPQTSPLLTVLLLPISFGSSSHLLPSVPPNIEPPPVHPLLLAGNPPSEKRTALPRSVHPPLQQGNPPSDKHSVSRPCDKQREAFLACARRNTSDLQSCEPLALALSDCERQQDEEEEFQKVMQTLEDNIRGFVTKDLLENKKRAAAECRLRKKQLDSCRKRNPHDLSRCKKVEQAWNECVVAKSERFRANTSTTDLFESTLESCKLRKKRLADCRKRNPDNLFQCESVELAWKECIKAFERQGSR